MYEEEVHFQNCYS